MSSFEERIITYAYTVNANSYGSTNLKALIDADLPSDYKCIGISGISSNSYDVVTIQALYKDSSFSLQYRNLVGTQKSQIYEIHYLCYKI